MLPICVCGTIRYVTTMAKHGTARATRREVVGLLPHAGQLLLAGLIILAIVQAVLPLIIIVTTGRLIDQITNVSRVGDVVGPLGTLAGSFVTLQVVESIRGVLVFRATSRIDGHLRTQAMIATSRPAGLAFLEEPELQDQLAVATARSGPFRPATPGGAAVGLIGLSMRFAQAAGATVLIAQFSVWLAFIMLLGTLLLRSLHHRQSVAMAQAFDEHLPSYRRAGYVSGLLLEPPAAKETRTFGLHDWLMASHGKLWYKVTHSMAAKRRQVRRRRSTYYLLAAPLNAVAFLLVGDAALEGRVDAGALTVVLQASLQLLALGNVGAEEHQIDFGTASLPALAALDQRSAAVRASESTGNRRCEGLPRQSIHFEGVSFAYPNGPALFDRLNLTVPAGSSLAIVGLNGAGKTTLIKLLARLHEPSAGRILVDGVDLRDLDLTSWRAQLAVIFQDFVRYELPVTENIGFGCLSRMGDQEALSRAATHAGTAALIEKLPSGWETVLARGYADGAELSGGEWQRVALARALLAVDAGAGVLALDEPTASLDVRAEAALFERLLQMTSAPVAQVAGRRVTTLLISHRFSTVRHAQQICVMDQGRIVEQGSHDELVNASGMYSRMFRLQASRFDG